jgi:hypothetical protein
VQAGTVLHRAEVGGQHLVEHLRLGELALVAAVRAVDVCQAVLRRPLVLGLVRLFEVVGAEPLVAGEALGERVGELLDVPGGLPDLAGQDDRGVEADHVLAPAHHGLPPLPLDVVLELHAERTVVVGGSGPAVDLAGREDDAARLCQADDGVDLVGGHGVLSCLSVRHHTRLVCGQPGDKAYRG